MPRPLLHVLWVLALVCFAVAAWRADPRLVAAGGAPLVLFLIVAARGRR